MAGWNGWWKLAGALALTAVAQPVLAEGAAVSEATAEQVEAAQKTFQEADALFDVQQYDQAITKYRKSYDTVASPNSRLMVARSLRELGRLDEAYNEYAQTLEEAEALAEQHSAYVTTANAARDELRALKSRVAWLLVELGDVPEDAELTVAGRPQPADALTAPIVVVPGRVDVVATASDGRVARAEVHLAAGRESTVTLKLDETVTVGEPAQPLEKPAPEPSSDEPLPPVTPQPPPAPKTPPRRGAYVPLAVVTGGLGVAGFAAFGVFGSQAKARFDDLDSACADGVCPADSQDDIDAGKSAQTFANIGLAVGAVGLAASGTLVYLGHRHRRERSQVAVAVLPGSVTIEGRF